MTELSFDIPNTPENQKAFVELRKEAEKHPYTLYGEDENGNVFPVMNVEKHPDCPKGWFEYMLKYVLNLVEEQK